MFVKFLETSCQVQELSSVSFRFAKSATHFQVFPSVDKPTMICWTGISWLWAYLSIVTNWINSAKTYIPITRFAISAICSGNSSLH